MGLPEPADGQGPRLFGVYPALVSQITGDPARLGRVQVHFPSLGTEGDRDVRAWATLCSPYADAGQGLQVMPEAGSQVIVAFEAGDPRRPYIVGAAWNGQAPQPNTPQATNDLRVWRTRSGSRLEFDDRKGAAKVTLTTSRNHQVVLDEGSQRIAISHPNGCSITITAAGSVDIRASASVNITAPTLNVNAPTSTFSGIVNCTTLNASIAITSPMYSQGVGNLW